MSRAIRPTLLFAGVMACVAGSIGSVADGAAKKRCRLKSRAVLVNRYVKVVQRTTDEETVVLFACARNSKRIYRIAEAGPAGLGSADVSVRASARTTVIVSAEESNQYGYGSSLAAAFLASGRVLFLDSTSGTIGSGSPSPTAPRSRYVLASRGQLARALVVNDTTIVLGYDTKGYERVLDAAPVQAIPVESLVVSGTVATWTRDGVARSADLALG